eukprot:7751222-Ditylum_brightwellii.AAC.1
MYLEVCRRRLPRTEQDSFVFRQNPAKLRNSKPPISFEVEEGADRKLGESRIYRLHTQLEEDNSPLYSLTVEVKQVLKGQNIGDMDTAYTLVWDLLKTPDNLDHCLNAVTV